MRSLSLSKGRHPTVDQEDPQQQDGTPDEILPLACDRKDPSRRLNNHDSQCLTFVTTSE